MTVRKAAIAGAMAVTDEFLATFNAGDAGRGTRRRSPTRTCGSRAERCASGLRSTKVSPLWSGRCPRCASARQWDHSEWDHRRVIHDGDDKVHLDVQFTRYRADGSVIGVYPAVYVIVRDR